MLSEIGGMSPFLGLDHGRDGSGSERGKKENPPGWNPEGFRGADGNRENSCKINIYNTSFERVYLTVYFYLKVIPEKIARSTDHNNISSALITALVSFKVGFHKF